jgi:hypothetical protein
MGRKFRIPLWIVIYKFGSDAELVSCSEQGVAHWLFLGHVSDSGSYRICRLTAFQISVDYWQMVSVQEMPHALRTSGSDPAQPYGISEPMFKLTVLQATPRRLP